MSSYQKGDQSGIYHDVPDKDNGDRKRKSYVNILSGAVLASAVGFIGVYLFKMQTTAVVGEIQFTRSTTGVETGKNGELKLFDNLDRFVMEDFDTRSTFASFLPGIAGYFGKPTWAFYVNRGQGMATFGTESKEYPMLEFNAANKAYQLTPLVGFRTFIKGTRGGSSKQSFTSEPFAPKNARNPLDVNDDPTKPKRILFVGTNELEIEEIDAIHDITTTVKYFILPEENFASLVRRSMFTNTGTTPMTLDILDGLAKMEPYGGRIDWSLKNMGRTLEGWFGVYHPEGDDKKTMPFYKMSTESSDSASVVIELGGHYCLSFIETEVEVAELLPVIFDTAKVFGATTSLENPSGFDANTITDILTNPQYGFATTSSAFGAINQITIQPGESITVASIYGKASSIEEVPKIAKIVTQPGYTLQKFERARTLINGLTASVETSTVNKLFDGTVKQMYLDNGLRGGLPTIIGDVNSDMTYDEDDGVKVFHTFSRIHGDLERDYNAFKIVPSFFSQGPGNYRDIAQNRRDDVTFAPRLGSFDVQLFLGYIQADGYEPLTVESIVFIFEDKNKAAEVAAKVTSDARSEEILTAVLSGGPFRPGQLYDLCSMLNINISVSNEGLVNIVTASATDRAMGLYGKGYWGDHWDYYIDLIEAYLGVFPDKEESLMYDKQLRYFFSTATVKPRAEKYVLDLNYDASGKHVIQLDSTYFDQDKVAEQEAFRSSQTGLLGIEAQWQRTREGIPFTSSPIAKLFLLATIKYATRDAYGMGIEYEGGKPGWLDSMNGLPGMLGSGMPETYELSLLLKYVKKVVDKYSRPVVIPTEIDQMITSVNEALDKLLATGFTDNEELPEDVPLELFTYWDQVASARENYRNNVEYYFSGNTVEYSATKVSKMIARWLTQVELGMDRAMYFATRGYEDDGTSGIPPCFFSYNVTDFEENGGKNDVGHPLVNAKAMKVRRFPLFLEGPVRYMKTIQDDKEKMKIMHQNVLNSGLRDNELNMYYLSASLTGQTYDMGRQVAFAPGWLENQSIWTHMSYKFYLQLIRGKLYEQFFAEMKGGGILPFMDPKVYGRSVMECSSFISSSAFPDPALHGKGFLARLSGSTAEFMSMWKLMFLGPNLFIMNETGDVEMQLTPALPTWLFEDVDADNDSTYDNEGNHLVSFKLFAEITVTYHNKGGVAIYGIPPKRYIVEMKDGTIVNVDGPTIPTETAVTIRRVSPVKSIDAYF